MRDKFTKSAQKALDNSLSVAKSFGHGYIGTEHLLIALVKTKGVAAEVMRENGVEEEKLRVLIEEMIETGEGVAVAERPQYTPRARKIIENSITEAERLGSAQAGTEHILIAMLKETECLGVRLLNTRGINVQKLYVDLLTATGQDVNSAKNEYMMQKSRRNKSATPMLDQYSRNLTEYAKDGKLDPVIGRDREITRLIEILSRRTKNNPCLVGEPGVGKTAVVEGLAQKIAAGDVPDIIKDKKVLTLDLSGMVAGSKYRGEFEERIKRAVREVTQSGNILLFIDEINRCEHTVQQELMNLILNREINGYKLHDDVKILAAMNPSSKYGSDFDYQVVDMDAAQENRFVWLNMEPDYNQWLNWAMDSGIEQKVIEFILTFPEYLHRINEDDVRATPRSYERVSKSYKVYKEQKDSIPRNVFLNVIKGNVGKVIAEEFISFVESDCSPLISYEDVFSCETLSSSVIEKVKSESHTRLYLSAMNILKTLESNLKNDDNISENNINRFIEFLKLYPVDLMVGIMKDIKSNYINVYNKAIENEEFVELYFESYSMIRG